MISPGIGAGLFRASSVACDAVAETRMMSGFDSVLGVDPAFVASPAGGYITVPVDGLYACSAHARLNSTEFVNFAYMYIAASARNDDSNPGVVVGPVVRDAGGTTEMLRTGICYLPGGAKVTAWVRTADNIGLIGDQAGAYYYLRVALVGVR